MELVPPILKTTSHLAVCLKLKNVCGRLPVSDAVVSVVAQGVIVRPPPGDGGPGPTTHFTPQSNAVAALTCYITDRDEELWRSW